MVLVPRERLQRPLVGALGPAPGLLTTSTECSLGFFSRHIAGEIQSSGKLGISPHPGLGAGPVATVGGKPLFILSEHIIWNTPSDQHAITQKTPMSVLPSGIDGVHYLPIYYAGNHCLQDGPMVPRATWEGFAVQQIAFSYPRLLQKSMLSDGTLYPQSQRSMRLGNEEIERIFSGLENNKRLQGLSLRYCGLGPWSGQRLGSIISQSAICKLHLDGNYLQCSGSLALLRPLAEYAEMQGKEPPATASPDTRNPTQQLHKIKNKKRLTEAGPWLVKLHLADNGIDGKGEEGESLLEFTQMLTCLIKYSAHVREIDLGNNILGEMAAAHILGALRARKTGKLPVLKITVSPDHTFRSIWKNSKKSNTTYKKKNKVRSWVFVLLRAAVMADVEDGEEPCALSSHSGSAGSKSGGDKMFSLKKWNAVAMWSWDVECDTCAICRVQVMDACLRCQAENKQEDCVVVWGECNHSFHNCCMSLWVKQNNRCPLCQQDWVVQRIGK
ncbi:RING-box protein 2 [Heterocephalus glaber]|nr:RING-box protein 2 [Heterocephalus glaber]